jgi:hypothetical protein
LAAAGDEDVGAFGGQALGGGEAYAAVTASDYGYFPFVLGHCVFLLGCVCVCDCLAKVNGAGLKTRHYRVKNEGGPLQGKQAPPRQGRVLTVQDSCAGNGDFCTSRYETYDRMLEYEKGYKEKEAGGAAAIRALRHTFCGPFERSAS